MCTRDLVVVVVSRDDGEAMFDCRCGDQRVGELDGALYAGGSAVAHESCPGDHHRFADRDRVRVARERERVGSARADLVAGGQDAERAG